MKRFLFLLFVPLFFLPKPKYELSVCAIFRDEARFLPEWIEHHKKLGAEHFYLFNNLSVDNYRDVLAPYMETGLVELFDWPYESGKQKEWNYVQRGAYNLLLQTKGNESRWLAIIDTDEFIIPLKAKTLPAFLKNYQGFGGVCINWQLYGTSNVEKLKGDESIMQTLVRKAPKDYERNCFVKTIFQPRRVKKLNGPHVCHYKKGFFHVDENFRRFARKSMTDQVSVNKIKINHYTTRDLVFYREEKMRRYLAWFPDKPLPDPEALLESTTDQEEQKTTKYR